MSYPDLLSIVDARFTLRYLCQWGEVIKIFGDVGIENLTIMLCHFQSAMPQQMLKRKGVPITINQILSGESMTEQVARGFSHPSASIVSGNSLTQGTL